MMAQEGTGEDDRRERDHYVLRHYEGVIRVIASAVGSRGVYQVDSSWMSSPEDLSLKDNEGNWDQFEANMRKIVIGGVLENIPIRLLNVTSSFDENFYTTRLDTPALTKQQIADAERLATEISSKPSSNIHVREERNMMTKTDDSMGEEERFGDVLGTGGLAHTTLNNGSGDGNGLRQPFPRDHDVPTTMAYTPAPKPAALVFPVDNTI